MRSGKVVLSQEGVADVEVPAGETVHIAPGTRFQPSFPVDTEYVPVGLPAFRPDRCVREDTTDEGSAVAAKLRKLHDGSAAPSCMADAATASSGAAAASDGAGSAPEVLYHMVCFQCLLLWGRRRHAHAIGATVRFGVASRPRHRCASTA